jgi:hypothetical protein
MGLQRFGPAPEWPGSLPRDDNPFRLALRFFAEMSEWADLTRHRGEAADNSAASSTSQNQTSPINPQMADKALHPTAKS